MENPFYQVYQEGKLRKDIEDRERIIHQFLKTSYIDRNSAIEKIMELRNRDYEIMTTTLVNQLGKPTIPLHMCSDRQLAYELNEQVEMLKCKLAQNTTNLMNDTFTIK